VIRFEPLAVRDLPLLREWLEREHVRRWWRDPIEDAMAEYAASAEASAPGEHYLIVVDDRPVGMAQTYLVSDYPEWDEIVQAGPGVAGLDLFIGEADSIGRGLGPRVLTEFVQCVVFRRPVDDRVCRDGRGDESPVATRVREGRLPARTRGRGGRRASSPAEARPTGPRRLTAPLPSFGNGAEQDPQLLDHRPHRPR
jgi:hypothetical protein